MFGDLNPGRRAPLPFNFDPRVVAVLAPQLKRHVAGLVLANNAADSSNDINVAPGVAVDSSDSKLLQLATTLTKRLDASFGVGANAGMLDGTESVAGTPDNDTWYYLHLIGQSKTSVVDMLASESFSAPVMPGGFDLRAPIGVVRRDTAANRQFRQIGDFFYWRTIVSVLSNGQATGETAITMSSAFPTEALTFDALIRGEHTSTNQADARNHVNVRIVTGVDFAAPAVRTRGGSGNYEASNAAVFRIPWTGNFYYYQTQGGGALSSRGAWVDIVGFEFPRG